MKIFDSFLKFVPLLFSLIPIVLIFILVILLIYMFKAKVKIKFKSFFGKSFRPSRGPWGTYVYNGFQGKGKSYSIIEYLYDNNGKIQTFSNIHNISNIDNITYFTGFKQMIEIKDKLDMMDYFKRDFIIFNNQKLYIDKSKQLVFVYDELFTELNKGSKLGQDIIDFLCQMRKRQIICLTTCQIWGELPLSWRRHCRYQIDCEMYPFLNMGFLVKTFKDAERMKWSNDDQEHIAPVVETTVTKTRKIVADSYDTRLRVSSTIYNVPIEYCNTSSLGVQSTPQGEEREVNIENGISQQSENMPAFLFTSHK